MRHRTRSSSDNFPLHGARARLLGRFERDFAQWLDTSDGRFAVWQAREPCWVQAARLARLREEEALQEGSGRIG